MDISIKGEGLQYYRNVLDILRNFKPFDDMTNTETAVLVFYIYKYHQLKAQMDDENIAIILNSPTYKKEAAAACNMQIETFRTFSYKVKNRKLLDLDYLPTKFFRTLSDKEFLFNIKVINEKDESSK